MKKLVTLALVIVMLVSLSATAFAATRAEEPGDYTAEVTGSYVEGYESNGIVYCVDITWSDLDFTYHAEKGAVWDPVNLKYSEIVPAYWEGEGTINVENRSNTKITAVPSYQAAAGYGTAGMEFSTDDLRVASAESGTAQNGSITVTPTGSLPEMTEAATIGTITLTIAQDDSITVAELETLVQNGEALTSQWSSLKNDSETRDMYNRVADECTLYRNNPDSFTDDGVYLNSYGVTVYTRLLEYYNTMKAYCDAL